MARSGRKGGRGRGAIMAGAGLLAGSAVLLVTLAGAPPAPAASPEPLPADDPVAFLQKCLQRLDRVKLSGYSLRMHKQERIDGKLEPSEDIDVLVRTHPPSVFMRWLRGARGADRALYVEGANDGKILVHPVGLVGRLVGNVALDPSSPKVRESSRYSIKEVGLRATLVRTLGAWRAGDEKGAARVEYLGTRPVVEAGNRVCYVLRRTTPTPEDGVTETTVSIDRETWFQVGTVLEGPGGELIGAYYDRDIVLNPTFAPNQFEASALTE